MLHENLKQLRKSKGYTQEEMADRLNVVRQTISKWEKGYSVPDAEMLKKIADIFETDVSLLLGSSIEQDTSVDVVAEQLARINEQLVIKNRRSRRIWKAVGIVFLTIVVLQLLLVIVGMVSYESLKFSSGTYVEEYTEEMIEE